ncbi:serine/threonine-protein kinase [Streptomyces regalis]|uniref:non-specific serine/threonine protein kinase n=1 Tax=Streptomyces regalis TaxID=68262 RepID=A0A0X3VGH2_9ACTN|nr:serine/threonine-protein kinase [Streptomyces regalis]KUL43778.1 serine/threonine protein kinase [Streptomyces regalis]
MLIAGRYRLDASIGRGAMGEVWRAYDETLGRPVAVKLLLAQEADPTAASRFRLEAQTAGRLNHPNVVGVLDFGEYEDRLFLVMELVEGDSLARLASAGRLPAEQVARIAAQAAAGLAAAHRQGVVHRDIKPANLLLDADGTVKIGDFGIARFLDDPAAALTAAGQIVGTSLYLAPERALGRSAGPASDVYALGCVLYQLLTGRAPFQADTALAILHQHLDAAPVPPRELCILLPPAFENYLLGLLAKEPEERPTAQQAADWFAAGAWQGRPEPLPAAAPTSRQRTVSPSGPPPSPGLGPGQDGPVGEPGPATTYMLPSASGHTGRPSRRAVRQRPDVRHLVSRRPMLVSAVAGAVIFLAAMLVGMVWWSPDNSAAENSRTSPSSTTSPDPAASRSARSAEPSATPSPASPLPVLSNAAPSPSSSVLSDDEGQETEGVGGENAREKRKDKEEWERRGEDDG